MKLPVNLKDLLTNKRGQWAERLAEDYLTQHGLELIQRNYSCRMGEIDLIMQEQDTIIFVEVRYRKNDQYGGGIESIDYRKQKKLNTTAVHYLQNNDRYQEHPCRIDAMIITGQSPEPLINWIKNAF